MSKMEAVQKNLDASSSPEEMSVSGTQLKNYLPRTDVIETEEGINIRAEMPGVDDKSVNIMLEKNILTIDGQISKSADRPGYTMKIREYPVGNYHRTFTLSHEFDRDNIKGKIKNGVLSITLPRNREMAARKIEVQAG